LRDRPGFADNCRVADFSSADRVVWGQYAKFGEQIRIDAVQDIKNDRTMPLKVEIPSEKDIPGGIDRLADSIRQKLALSDNVLKELKANSFNASSESVTALRDYQQGVQLAREGKNLDALKNFRTATTEDPQFALAFFHLADVNSQLGYDAEAEQASRKAMELTDSQNLPLPEKYRITAGHAGILKDNKKAIEAYENLAKSQPGDTEVQYALASLYVDVNDYAKAKTLLSKILESDPKNLKALWEMGIVENFSGNPQAAVDPLSKGLAFPFRSTIRNSVA
jgi:tetratricopeptide (TPR) repeat protein